MKAAPGAIPYVLMGLLVDTGGSERWGWFAIVEAISVILFLAWFGKPCWRVWRRSRAA